MTTTAWVVIGIFAFVMFVVMTVVETAKNMEANNAALGASAATALRATGLNYLGGHPSAPSAVNGCNLVITDRTVAIEKGTVIHMKMDLSEVGGISVETEEEARRRYTATRMLAVGVFALALPKKTAGSVLVLVDTAQGPLTFEKPKTSKAETLRLLGPLIAAAGTRSLGPAHTTPAEAALTAPPAVGVADELAKLVALRDSGELTDEEFSRQKAKLLSDGA